MSHASIDSPSLYCLIMASYIWMWSSASIQALLIIYEYTDTLFTFPHYYYQKNQSCLKVNDLNVPFNLEDIKSIESF